MIEPYLASMKTKMAERAHGTRLRYISGCKCMLCRAANSRYEVDRAAARRNGDWNGYVSAAKAREWLRRLSAQGIGRDAIHDASGVSVTVINDVRMGRKLKIRARTERKLLAVDGDARADRSLVPAGPTWRLIDELVRGGYRKGWIAQKLGRKMAALQLNRKFVTAKNALAVERLYKMIQEGMVSR